MQQTIDICFSSVAQIGALGNDCRAVNDIYIWTKSVKAIRNCKPRNIHLPVNYKRAWYIYSIRH